jgi:hypothetical protein
MDALGRQVSDEAAVAVKNDNTNVLLAGKTSDDQAIVLQGTALQSNDLSLILHGVIGVADGLPLVLAGKPYDELGMILDSRAGDDLGIILNAVDSPQTIVCYNFKEDEITGFQLTSGDLVNEITVNFDYDFAGGKYRGAITKHNPLSKLLYGDVKKSLSLQMVPGARQAEKICDATIMTSSVPQIIAAFQHDLRSIRVEVGDIGSLTHSAGLGENGYASAIGTISERNVDGIKINYKMIMKATGSLYASELLSLTQVSSSGSAGITIVQESPGVYVFTVYVILQGGATGPIIEGAKMTISGVIKFTDKKGQVRFNLQTKGTYTAYIEAGGYEIAEYTFTI